MRSRLSKLAAPFSRHWVIKMQVLPLQACPPRQGAAGRKALGKGKAQQLTKCLEAVKFAYSPVTFKGRCFCPSAYGFSVLGKIITSQGSH